MPRPTTKEQLLSQSQLALDELMGVVASLPVAQRIGVGACGDWSVKDISCHLHAWHELFVVWYREGMAGGKPAIPAPGFTFKDTPILNEKVYREYKELDYIEAVTRLIKSHQWVMALAGNHTEAELFTKQCYPWTGSTSLGAYFTGCLSSHYNWANGLVKKWRRGLVMLGAGDEE